MDFWSRQKAEIKAGAQLSEEEWDHFYSKVKGSQLKFAGIVKLNASNLGIRQVVFTKVVKHVKKVLRG